MLFQVCSFIQQILEGLGHIHSMNILHLDIKVRLFGFVTLLTISENFMVFVTYFSPFISVLSSA